MPHSVCSLCEAAEQRQHSRCTISSINLNPDHQRQHEKNEMIMTRQWRDRLTEAQPSGHPGHQRPCRCFGPSHSGRRRGSVCRGTRPRLDSASSSHLVPSSPRHIKSRTVFCCSHTWHRGTHKGGSRAPCPEPSNVGPPTLSCHSHPARPHMPQLRPGFRRLLCIMTRHTVP